MTQRLVVIALMALAAKANAETVEKSFDATGLKRLVVRNSRGDTRVNGYRGAAKVVANKVRFDSGCRLRMEREGDALVVEAPEPGSWMTHCEVRFEISVPPELGVEIKTGSGDVGMRGMSGAVSVLSGSGDVALDGEISNLVGRVGSGGFKATGLNGSGEIATGSGNVEVVFHKVPQKGELKLRSGSGDTKVFVPGDANIRATLRTGSGRVENQVGDRAGAGFAIQAQSGSGDLSILKSR
jgi:hypothetical protein